MRSGNASEAASLGLGLGAALALGTTGEDPAPGEGAEPGELVVLPEPAGEATGAGRLDCGAHAHTRAQTATQSASTRTTPPACSNRDTSPACSNRHTSRVLDELCAHDEPRAIVATAPATPRVRAARVDTLFQ